MKNLQNILQKILQPRLVLHTSVSIALIFAVSVAFTFLMFYLQPGYTPEIIANLSESNYMAFLLNFLPIMAFSLLLFFISNSLGLSIGLVGLVVIFLNLVNRNKVFLRSDPLFPWELSMSSEVIFILRGFPLRQIAMYVALIGFIIAISIIASFVIRSKKINLKIRAALIIITAGLIFYVNSTVYHNVRLFASLPVVGNVFNQASVFDSRGFLYSFIFSNNTQRITKADDFDIRPINQIKAEFEPKDLVNNVQKPHIIMIMSEAFSTMSNHPQVSFDNFYYDPLYYFNQLVSRDDVISGYLIVPNVGGGTGDTEFDVLSGMNTRALRGAPYPYRLISNYFESLPSLLNELGYRSIAMHPGFAWFYNRQNVYRYLGFEHFYCISYFDPYTQLKGNYISEEASYDKIFDIWHRHMEEQPNTPLFSFNVMIQNHGPYTMIYGIEQNFDTTLDLSQGQIIDASNYFHGVRDCDLQLNRLLTYFENHQEPVVVVYFSDHLPALGTNTFNEFFPDIHPVGSFYNLTRLNATPFAIWQNQSAQRITPILDNFLDTSYNTFMGSNFFGAFVMELLEFNNMSPFFDFVNSIRPQFPVILEDRAFTPDRDVSIYLPPEEREIIRIYRDWQFERILS